MKWLWISFRCPMLSHMYAKLKKFKYYVVITNVLHFTKTQKSLATILYNVEYVLVLLPRIWTSARALN